MRTDGGEGLAEVARCRAAGERAYERMYEARDPAELAWQTELAVDAFREAYRLANDLGFADEAAAILQRLVHVKAVGRQLR